MNIDFKTFKVTEEQFIVVFININRNIFDKINHLNTPVQVFSQVESYGDGRYAVFEVYGKNSSKAIEELTTTINSLLQRYRRLYKL